MPEDDKSRQFGPFNGATGEVIRGSYHKPTDFEILSGLLFAFKIYLNRVEAFFEREAQFSRDYLEKRESEIEDGVFDFDSESEERMFGFGEQVHSELNGLFGDYFPSILRASLFVNIYSVLESQLNKVCDKIKERKHLSCSVDDLDGCGIGRAEYYLRKVAGLDLHRLGWKKLMPYRSLRNCIVHDEGRLRLKDGQEDYKKLRKFVAKHSFLELSRGFFSEPDLIRIKKGFCEQVIKDIETFFTELDKVIGVESESESA